MSEIQLYNFSAAVVGGTAKTILVPLLGAADFLCAPTGIEVSLKATKSGAGVSPTIDVKVQTSPDNFVTTALTHDALAMTQLTDTGQETKSVTFSSTVFQLRQARLSIVADTASGDATFAGFVLVTYFFR